MWVVVRNSDEDWVVEAWGPFKNREEAEQWEKEHESDTDAAVLKLRQPKAL